MQVRLKREREREELTSVYDVGGTVRSDGTLRPMLKVKQGYIPQEE